MRSKCFYGCYNLRDFTIEESDKIITIESSIFSTDVIEPYMTNLTILCAGFTGSNRFPYAVRITANVIDFNIYTGKTTELHFGPRVSSVNAQKMNSYDGMSISVDENNVTYSSVDGVLFNKNKTELVRFSKDVLQRNYEIPSSVTSIGDYAFSYCYAIESISIPSSVTSIGANAFYECSKLTSVSIPSGVTVINENTFQDCSSLAQISLPNTLKEIHSHAFDGCSALESINIPSSVTSISDYAFRKCSSLASEIEIPRGVRYLDQYIFEGCSSLPSIKILGTYVQEISDMCFSGCVSLKSIYCNTPEAPITSSHTFGNRESTYTGRNTYNTSENILYVPANSTGYDSSYWLSPLCDSTYCGFTLSQTL